MTSERSLTFIKTPFMKLLEPGQPPQEYLQACYGLILEQHICANDQALIDLVESQFPGITIDGRWFDYIREPRVLFADKEHLIIGLLEPRLFSKSEGKLICFVEGRYELIKTKDAYCLALQRYAYADYYGEEIKKIPVTEEQVQKWQVQGKEAIDKFVEQQRLQLWTYQPVWLVTIKAKLESASCSFAFDGSEFYVMYVCVPADSAAEAQEKSIEHLQQDCLSAETIYAVKPFVSDEFQKPGEFSREIIERATEAYKTQRIHSYISPPYGMTSLLITPYATIISIWHCDYDFWSKRTETIELCEFFPDASLCFERLVELNKVTTADYEKFIQLDDGDGTQPLHYRVLSEGKDKFKKIQRSFEADGSLMINWEDWHYDFYKKGDDYYLWVYIGGIADKTVEIKLVDHQVARYEREGISYIHELIRQV
jgi:hypothetical protein